MRRRVVSPVALDSIPLLAILASSVSAGNVTWISPSAGDVYASGDTIVGEWDSEEAFSSPSFSLCSSDSDGSGQGCGSEVWPTIDQNGGSSLIYLSLPNVSSPSKFHLQMEDSGQTAKSPSFSLSPHTISNNVSTSPSSLPAASIPLASSSTSASSLQPVPNFTESTMPTPTAAYAVPLALVVSVLFAAGALCVHHRRKLREERARERQSLSRQGSTDWPEMGGEDFTSFPASMRRGRMDGSVSSRASTPTVSVAGSYRGLKDFEATPGGRGTAMDEDDKMSLYSVASLKRQPVVRRMTREPYYRERDRDRLVGAGFTFGRRRAAKMPAGVFRAGVSPMPPTLSRFSSQTTEFGKQDACKGGDLEKETHHRQHRDQEKGLNASVEDSVVERYFHPSPVPPALSPGMGMGAPAQPERLYVRRCAGEQRLDYEKPLPRCPAELYDEVAKRVSGRR